MISNNKNTKVLSNFSNSNERHNLQNSLSNYSKISKWQHRLPNSKLCNFYSNKSLLCLLDKIKKRIYKQEKRLERFPTPKTPRLIHHKTPSDFKKVGRKTSKKGIATLNVWSSRNNTQLTLSYPGGKVLKSGWVSGGSVGFKNSRKSTLYASQVAARALVSLARKQAIRGFYIKLRGIGRAKSAVVRVINQSKLKIWAIRECTPTVHNGCRSPKSRRI